MHEPLPLATVQGAIFRFLSGRDDAVVFGAQAVNAYASIARMSEDVDLLSPRAEALAEELRSSLAATFHIATRTREVGDDVGFRVYQLRSPKNRHLADVRQVAALPSHRVFENVRMIDPDILVAQKVVAMVARAGRPKAATDLADAQRLLLALPELRAEHGPVERALIELGANGAALARWHELATAPLLDDEDA